MLSSISNGKTKHIQVDTTTLCGGSRSSRPPANPQSDPRHRYQTEASWELQPVSSYIPPTVATIWRGLYFCNTRLPEGTEADNYGNNFNEFNSVRNCTVYNYGSNTNRTLWERACLSSVSINEKSNLPC